MTDRELLELAAKAAGIELFYDIFYDEEPCYHEEEIDCNIVWNPLTEDGDALRLAVAIDATISQQLNYVCVMLPHGPTAIRGIAWTEPYNDNPCAATRRAIVCAAAEIGKSL